MGTGKRSKEKKKNICVCVLDSMPWIVVVKQAERVWSTQTLDLAPGLAAFFCPLVKVNTKESQLS